MHRNSQIARRTSQTTNGSRKSPGTVFFVWVWLWVPRNFACGEGWWFREILRAKFCGMVGPVRIGKGFRLLTAFAAEWWGPPEGTGGDGRREGSANAGALPAAAHLSFLSPLAAHHSAKRASVERNPPTNSGGQERASVERNPPDLRGTLRVPTLRLRLVRGFYRALVPSGLLRESL